jgi:hypothetical protein
MPDGGYNEPVENFSPRVALLRPATEFAAFDEIMVALADALTQAGAAVRTLAHLRDSGPAHDDLLLVIGSPTLHPHLPRNLGALRRSLPALRVFLWHMEHLLDADTPLLTQAALRLKARVEHARRGDYANTRAGNFLASQEAARLALFDRVLVFTRRKADFLRARGIDADYLPLGHHAVWGWTDADDTSARDIDVLFLGMLHGRRQTIMDDIQARLAPSGVRVQTNYDFNPSGAWGEERNALLSRAKVFLSIYRYPGDGSGMRFSMGMGNGALVVSEPVADPDPFAAGRDFVQAPVPALADAILAALSDPPARLAMCRAAQDCLRAHYSLQGSAERILALLRETGPY